MMLLRHARLPAAPRVAALVAVAALAVSARAWAAPPVEIHQRLDTSAAGHERDIALTLDACSGAVDTALVTLLVRQRIAATLFVTQRWLQRNPTAARELLAHADLFELQNHGARHVPAVIGQRLYGMAGVADLPGLKAEVDGAAQALVQLGAPAPRWYRGAGAAYDAASRQALRQWGYGIAGFSVNADAGATLPAAAVSARLLKARAGDIVLAHMNHPRAGTGAGIAAALPVLQQRGLRFVTLSQAARVVDLP